MRTTQFSSSSSLCSWRVRHVSCSLILKMKLVPPSLPRSSYVPSSFGLYCSACFDSLFVSILSTKFCYSYCMGWGGKTRNFVPYGEGHRMWTVEEATLHLSTIVCLSEGRSEAGAPSTPSLHTHMAHQVWGVPVVKVLCATVIMGWCYWKLKIGVGIMN